MTIELKHPDEEIPLSKTDDELSEIVALLEQLDDRKRYRRMDFFQPYPKQEEFFDLGLFKGERMLRAGNQLGKTEAGAFEMACHLTGEYPDWWLGRRFLHPVKGWAVGLTTQVTRDVLQEKLCGEPGVELAFGTGFIPKEAFNGSPTLARGITGAYDTIQVTHKTNSVVDGVSILKFKSAEQGREKFQSSTLDLFWSDEETPFDIYTELLARISATGGMGYVTFTPLQGKTTLVERFQVGGSDIGLVKMRATDAKHMTPERIAANLARYPAHEREARMNGEPMLGSGRIFPYAEDLITEPPLQYIPGQWLKGWGIDFGLGGETAHPFAAVLMLWDRDNDVIHIHAAMKMSDGLPINFAAAMKPIGVNVPVSWPHDGNARESNGVTLAKSYKAQGLRMQPFHAQFEDGGYSTEAGVLEMQQRMTTGRLKIAAQLSLWFEEFRDYHRKDGLIVKLQDDLMSATRIGIMDRRHWKICDLGGKKTPRNSGQEAMAIGHDDSPW